MLLLISNETQRSRLSKVMDLTWKKTHAYWAWFRIKVSCTHRVTHRRPTPDTEYPLPQRSMCRCDFIGAGHRMNLDMANHLIYHFRVCEPSFLLNGYAFACCRFRVYPIRPMSFWSWPMIKVVETWIVPAILISKLQTLINSTMISFRILKRSALMTGL